MAERTLIDRLRDRRVTRWVHGTGETPRSDGYAVDVDCQEAADEIEQLRAVVAHAANEIEALDDETAQIQAWALRELLPND